MLFFSILMACSGGGNEITGDIATGEATYTSTCASCHGADGKGATTTSPAAADLTVEINDLTDAEISDVMLNGKGEMPGYAAVLADQDVADVLAYLHDAFGG